VPSRRKSDVAHAQRVFERPPAELGRMLLAVAERNVFARTANPDDPDATSIFDQTLSMARHQAIYVLPIIAKLPFSLSKEQACEFLAFVAVHGVHVRSELAGAIDKALQCVEVGVKESPLTESERYVLAVLRAAIITGPPLGSPSEEVQRL